jgi:hypothetical protein
MNEETTLNEQEDLWCYYSNMPSPLSYINCESCGNSLVDCKCKKEDSKKTN